MRKLIPYLVACLLSAAAPLEADVIVSQRSFDTIYCKLAGCTMTGPILAPNGTASAPSYAFSSSTGLGFYSAASNSLGMSLTGTSIFTFTANGAGVDINNTAAGNVRFYANGNSNSIIMRSPVTLGDGVTGGALTANGPITPSQTAGIVGTTTNNNANAGSVGEYVSSTITSASAVALTTNTTANVTSVSLTAGDWDCTGAVDFQFAATTSYTNLVGGTSSTSATIGAQDSAFDFETPAAVPTAGHDMTWTVPTTRYLLAATTTVYLVAQGTFTVDTLKAYGTLRCRRMR